MKANREVDHKVDVYSINIGGIPALPRGSIVKHPSLMSVDGDIVTIRHANNVSFVAKLEEGDRVSFMYTTMASEFDTEFIKRGEL